MDGWMYVWIINKCRWAIRNLLNLIRTNINLLQCKTSAPFNILQRNELVKSSEYYKSLTTEDLTTLSKSRHLQQEELMFMFLQIPPTWLICWQLDSWTFPLTLNLSPFKVALNNEVSFASSFARATMLACQAKASDPLFQWHDGICRPVLAFTRSGCNIDEVGDAVFSTASDPSIPSPCWLIPITGYHIVHGQWLCLQVDRQVNQVERSNRTAACCTFSICHESGATHSFRVLSSELTWKYLTWVCM